MPAFSVLTPKSAWLQMPSGARKSGCVGAQVGKIECFFARCDKTGYRRRKYDWPLYHAYQTLVIDAAKVRKPPEVTTGTNGGNRTFAAVALRSALRDKPTIGSLKFNVR
jgi:hypothetical protein